MFGIREARRVSGRQISVSYAAMFSVSSEWGPPQIGYKRRPGSYGGKPSVMVDNTLGRQFDVEAPDKVWVTDITYIRTQEGFAYLAVVIDLYSRRVVGWSMQSRQTTDVVLQVLLMAVWRRRPKDKVLIHSDSHIIRASSRAVSPDHRSTVCYAGAAR